MTYTEKLQMEADIYAAAKEQYNSNRAPYILLGMAFGILTDEQLERMHQLFTNSDQDLSRVEWPNMSA